MTDHGPTRELKWWQIALMIPYALLAFIVMMVVLPAIWLLVHLAIWTCWCARGRDVLFVYSDSPVWHDYIERHILPRLGERAVILNWSRRGEWRSRLARIAFSYFGGQREFNPLTVVFRPFRFTRTFRFWQPFRDFKHGNPDALHRMENDFFRLIEIQPDSATHG